MDMDIISSMDNCYPCIYNNFDNFDNFDNQMKMKMKKKKYVVLEFEIHLIKSEKMEHEINKLAEDEYIVADTIVTGGRVFIIMYYFSI